MLRRLSLVLTLPGLFVATPHVAHAVLRPSHTKKQAEVNVLRVVPRKWAPKRMPGLVDRQTGLLVDNTEAICYGHGRRRAGNRYSSFLCLVRPHVHKARQGLYLSYRALPGGRFRIQWLAYRRR